MLKCSLSDFALKQNSKMEELIMKKSTAIISFLIVIACMVGLGYIMFYGIDKNESGATKNTKLI